MSKDLASLAMIPNLARPAAPRPIQPVRARDSDRAAQCARKKGKTEKEARGYPERSAISRCLGRELIASLDRLSMPLRPGDRLIVCTDGLYGVLEDRELEYLCRGLSASDACRRLIDEANVRGTADNATAAFLLSHNGAPNADPPGWGARLRRLGR